MIDLKLFSKQAKMLYLIAICHGLVDSVGDFRLGILDSVLTRCGHGGVPFGKTLSNPCTDLPPYNQEYVFC